MTCPCGKPIVLYWLDDGTWQQVAQLAPAPNGHLCLKCVEHHLGRKLTLGDLCISNYLRTTNCNAPEFMREYTRSTVIGACQHIGREIPAGWEVPTEKPHVDALEIGKHLAANTADIESMVDSLINQTDNTFADCEPTT